MEGPSNSRTKVSGADKVNAVVALWMTIEGSICFLLQRVLTSLEDKIDIMAHYPGLIGQGHKTIQRN